LKANA